MARGMLEGYLINLVESPPHGTVRNIITQTNYISSIESPKNINMHHKIK